jgi:hypothetical protein
MPNTPEEQPPQFPPQQEEQAVIPPPKPPRIGPDWITKGADPKGLERRAGEEELRKGGSD